MKPSNHPQLGRVVGHVIRAVDGILNDPMNDYAGFTPDPASEVERIVRRAGFANARHFAAVVRARTSHRWSWMNLGPVA